MIEIKSVTKKYGEFTAIEDINLTVADCSVMGIAGYNGSGKTTLLNVCAGIFKSESGAVYLDGADAFDNDVERKRMFYIPDDMWFPVTSSVKSAAKYYKSYYPDFDFDVFSNLCGVFGLDENKKVKELSKGMKRQASIAIAFASNAKYVLIDETFDGLDPQKKELFKKILLEYINETSASVIVTSHDLAELSGICDHAVLLNGTHVQMDCDISDVSEHFRRVTMIFERPVNESAFSGINIRKLRISGLTATMLIFGDIEAETEKLKELNAKNIDSEELTLEEVFTEEMNVENAEQKISGLFSAKSDKK